MDPMRLKHFPIFRCSESVQTSTGSQEDHCGSHHEDVKRGLWITGVFEQWSATDDSATAETGDMYATTHAEGRQGQGSDTGQGKGCLRSTRHLRFKCPLIQLCAENVNRMG